MFQFLIDVFVREAIFEEMYVPPLLPVDVHVDILSLPPYAVIDDYVALPITVVNDSPEDVDVTVVYNFANTGLDCYITGYEEIKGSYNSAAKTYTCKFNVLSCSSQEVWVVVIPRSSGTESYLIDVTIGSGESQILGYIDIVPPPDAPPVPDPELPDPVPDS